MLRSYASRDGRGALWERLSDVCSVHDADAWKRVGDFGGDRPGVLFFAVDEEVEMFVFERSRDIGRVLAECHGFEFSVTDPAASYVLCFNHHDMLIAAGDAREWLAELSR